jgi:hypothetical protein
MPGPTQRLNTYERKSTISSGDVDIHNAVETVNHERVRAGDSGIELDTDRAIRTDELDYDLFMRDELEVFLNEASNENDPGFVEMNVNGDYRMVVRGDTVKLRRYHVAVLARAKQSRVRQKKIVNQDGSMGFIEENVLSLTYPFSVTHDPRGKKGGDWLKQMLSNPV